MNWREVPFVPGLMYTVEPPFLDINLIALILEDTLVAEQIIQILIAEHVIDEKTSHNFAFRLSFGEDLFSSRDFYDIKHLSSTILDTPLLQWIDRDRHISSVRPLWKHNQQLADTFLDKTAFWYRQYVFIEAIDIQLLERIEYLLSVRPSIWLNSYMRQLDERDRSLQISPNNYLKDVHGWFIPFTDDTRARIQGRFQRSSRKYDIPYSTQHYSVVDVFTIVASVAGVTQVLLMVIDMWSRNAKEKAVNKIKQEVKSGWDEVNRIQVQMTDGGINEFNSWLSDPEKVKSFVEAFNVPSQTPKPLYVIFHLKNGKRMRLDVSETTTNKQELDAFRYSPTNR